MDEKSAGNHPFASAAAHLGMRKYSAVQLLIAWIAMLILIPFVQPRPDGDLVCTVLMTAVLLSALVATGSRQRACSSACWSALRSAIASELAGSRKIPAGSYPGVNSIEGAVFALFGLLIAVLI